MNRLTMAVIIVLALGSLQAIAREISEENTRTRNAATGTRTGTTDGRRGLPALTATATTEINLAKERRHGLMTEENTRPGTPANPYPNMSTFARRDIDSTIKHPIVRRMRQESTYTDYWKY